MAARLCSRPSVRRCQSGVAGLLVLSFLLTASVAFSLPQDVARITPTARPGTIGAVRVHGNHTTPDEDVRHLAGIAVGEPMPDGGTEAVAARLKASGRFRRVDVRVRQRSLEDPSDLALIVIVEEHPAPSVAPVPAPVRWLRNTGAGLMWLPILDYEDAYGFTYGARFTFVDALGERSRVSVPATWGGTRRVAVEVERRLARPARVSLTAGAGVWQREHPHHDADERRTEGWLGAAVSLGGRMRLEPRLAWASVDFAGTSGGLFTGGADVVLDTRLNPALPRNALFVRAGVETVRPEDWPSYRRTHADARAYVGVIGTSVLAVRGRVEDASGPQVPYLQPWLGGTSSLRGLRPGALAGDRLVAASVELRVPFSSPLRVGTLGAAVFLDTGAVGAHGTPFSALEFERSLGAGLFLALPVFSLNLDVAHAVGHGTRLHVATGVRF